jgi:hypothetical protein
MATNPAGPNLSSETPCLFCKHMGHEGAKITTCLSCGDHFCSVCSQCACDRLAAYLADLGEVQKKESRVSLLQRFIQEWAG